MLKFEWDHHKNEKNIRERNLDFADAVEMFDVPMLVNVDVRADYKEQRCVGYGSLNNRVMAVIYTQRQVDVVRIISFRKANKREQAQFETYLKNKLGKS